MFASPLGVHGAPRAQELPLFSPMAPIARSDRRVPVIHLPKPSEMSHFRFRLRLDRFLFLLNSPDCTERRFLGIFENVSF